MRWATVRVGDATRAARREGDEYVLLDAEDVGALLHRGAHAEDGHERIPASDADLAPLVTAPAKIICVGLNYRSHILEMGRSEPTHPTLFAKFASTLTGARDPIRVPAHAHDVDWEAELAVVVGRRVHHADLATARGAIAGYTVANDVSMRDWQWRTTQWLQGKTFDATTPLGPELVTPDEIDHASDLRLTCLVDGVTRQEARTSDLVFDAPAVISYISQFTSLGPGDVVLTGTPGGTGAPTETWLSNGSVLTTSIEGIGSCVNEVIVATSSVA